MPKPARRKLRSNSRNRMPKPARRKLRSKSRNGMPKPARRKLRSNSGIGMSSGKNALIGFTLKLKFSVTF